MSGKNLVIKGKTVLVTGATRGIGRAIVDELLRYEVKKIYAVGRKIEELQSLQREYSGTVFPIQHDLSKEDDINSLANKVTDVQILINNAGVLGLGSVDAENFMETYEENFKVNLFALIKLTHFLIPYIKKNGSGAIVNLSSLVGLFNMPMGGMYSISKAAVHSYTQAIRAELGKDDILVSGVYPGPIDTDMLKGMEMEKDSPQNVAKSIIEGISLRREYIFPDSFSKEIQNTISSEFLSAEKQFAQFI